MLAKQPLEYGDATLLVKRCQQTPEGIDFKQRSVTIPDQEAATFNTVTTPSDDDGVPLLEVIGISAGTTRRVVELFFENAKKSGGGDIKQLDYREGNDRAVIMFQKKEGEIPFRSLYKWNGAIHA